MLFSSADVVGVIAEFVPQTTEAQRTLMLVCNTWYRGVIEQDGMKPRPGIQWPWCALQERQPRSVSVCGTFGDVGTTIERAANVLPHLEHLKIAGWTTCKLYDHVAKLQSLQSLHLTAHLHDSSPRPFLEKLCLSRQNNEFPCHLSKLKMVHFTFADADFELLCGTFAAQLKAVEVDKQEFAASTMTDKSFMCLAQCKNLHTLHLSASKHVTDAAFHHLAGGCIALKALAMPACPQVSDKGLKTLVTEGESWVSQMTSLNIRGCGNITHEGIEAVASGMVNLTSLDVGYCLGLTDAAMRCIRLKTLRTLNLSGCNNISDDGFCCVAENLPQLTTLYMGSSKATDVSLRVISSELKKLTSLDVSFCMHITDDGIKHVADGLKNLTSLNVALCQSQ